MKETIRMSAGEAQRMQVLGKVMDSQTTLKAASAWMGRAFPSPADGTIPEIGRRKERLPRFLSQNGAAFRREWSEVELCA
ncbi:MAG: hypothetical protein ACYDH0_12145 [Candidatus Aminicenantales bacterium]